MGLYIIVGLIILGGLIYFLKVAQTKGANYNNMTITELKEQMNDQTVLIDVRTPKEISQGVIGKPLEIQLGPGIKAKLAGLDREKKYVVYCRSGRRSAAASQIMAGMGFTDVYNLEGGYLAWQNEN